MVAQLPLFSLFHVYKVNKIVLYFAVFFLVRFLQQMDGDIASLGIPNHITVPLVTDKMSIRRTGHENLFFHSIRVDHADVFLLAACRLPINEGQMYFKTPPEIPIEAETVESDEDAEKDF